MIHIVQLYWKKRKFFDIFLYPRKEDFWFERFQLVQLYRYDNIFCKDFVKIAKSMWTKQEKCVIICNGIMRIIREI